MIERGVLRLFRVVPLALFAPALAEAFSFADQA